MNWPWKKADQREDHSLRLPLKAEKADWAKLKLPPTMTPIAVQSGVDYLAVSAGYTVAGKDADQKTRIYLEYVIGLTTDEANEIADKIKSFYEEGKEI